MWQLVFCLQVGGIFLVACEDDLSIWASVLLGLFASLMLFVANGMRLSVSDPVANECHEMSSRKPEGPHEVCVCSAHCSPFTDRYNFRLVLGGQGKGKPFSRYSRCAKCKRMYCQHYFQLYSIEAWLDKVASYRAAVNAMFYPD